MNYASTFGRRRDADLSRFFTNVFWVMSIGLALTGAITMWISQDQNLMKSLFGLYTYMDEGKSKTGFTASGWWWLAVAVELVMVIAISWGGVAKSLSVGSCLLLFMGYAALNGVTLSPAIYAYTTASVTKVFFITAGTFGTCALFGAVTRINLLPLSGFFLMALIGLLIVLVVNLFYSSPMIDFLVSSVAVLLFAGLTAFDMQKLREMYDDSSPDMVPNLVVYGALTLYLDFLNMFLHLLRIFGIKKD